MGAVAGVRRTMRELVDGTLRVQIDIEPKDADTFRRLLPHVDMPVALAPLLPGFEASTGGDDFDNPEFKTGPPSQIATFGVNEAEAKELGGSTWATLGPLCQSAIMLAKDERFQKWAVHMVPDFRMCELDASDYIRSRCAVESRKQLDDELEASHQFRQMMREYKRWLHAEA